MAAVLVRFRADLRRRWRAWAGLALLVGLFGGVVLTTASLARRTQTAYPRMLRHARAAEILLSAQNAGLLGFYDDVAKLPEVAALGRVAGMPLVRLLPSGAPDGNVSAPGASVDGQVGYTLHRPNLEAGRLPRPDREDEVLASHSIAQTLHLRPGSTIELRALTPDQAASGQPAPDAPRVTFRVVGIGVTPEAVTGGSRASSGFGNLLLTPAWFRNHGDPEHLEYDGALIRLRPGADLGHFRDEVHQLAARHPEAGADAFFASYADRYAGVTRTIRPQWVALAVFAVLAAASTLLVMGQALSRELTLGSVDGPALRALGMSRAQLMTVVMVPAVVIAVAGAVLAVVAAALASGLTLAGPARLAEPHPGLAVNPAVLGLGGLGLVLLLAAWSAVPAWRAASAPARAGASVEPAAAGRPSRLAAAAARGGMPPSAAAGVRMAFEAGRGQTAVPVRSALIGSVVALATVVAAVSFAANLRHLVSTPRLYGWSWDVLVDGQFGSFPGGQARALLTPIPGVASVAGGDYGNVTIGGRAVAALGIDRLQGEVFPTVVEGRPPSGPDEIVLGTNTLQLAHRSVGQTVAVGGAAGVRPMRIVGRAVFPALGRGGFPPTSLGQGAAMTASALAPPDLPPESYNFFLVRFTAGADRAAVSARVRAAAQAAGCPPGQDCGVFENRRPGEIGGYARVQWTPLVLAGLLAVLATCTVGHALVSSIRRRRRDLAVLKTLGFVRRQVSASVAWQATSLAVTALLFGVPLGLVAGRWGWALFARQLGIGRGTVVPVAAVLVTIPAVLAVANLVAALPARAAARTRPALVLRTE